MNSLSIRKKSINTWLHTDSVFGDFIISKFYFNSFEAKFQIVEDGNTRLEKYLIPNITLYDDTDGGVAETFSTITELSLRLEELQYPAFDRTGTSVFPSMEQITNVNVTDIEDGQVLAWDATTSKWINTTVGGLTTPNLQQVTDVEAVTTNDVKFQLTETTYIIVKASTQEIEFYEDVSGTPTLRSKMNKNSLSIFRDGGGYMLIDGNSITVEGEVTDNAIGFSLDNASGTSALYVAQEGVDSALYTIDKIRIGIIDYPLPQGASSRIATLLDIDNAVSGMLDLRGAHDASSNAFPTTGGSGTSGAILKGDFWYVSVAGVLNGVTVNVGDSFFALIDSPTASDWQILESNLGYVPENQANKENTTLDNSTTKYPTNNLVFNERAPIVVSSSVTATINRVHNVVATSTLTDPAPTEGMGYMVNVINGVATVGGTAYSVGSQLYRHYHSGSWRTFVYPDLTTLTASIDGSLTKDIIEKGLIWQVPNIDGSYSSGAVNQYLRLIASPTTQNTATTLDFGMSVGVIQTTATAGTSGGLRRNDAINLQLYNGIITIRDFTVDNTISNDCRYIVGFSKNYQFAFPSNAEPTTFTECILVAKLSTSNNLFIVYNDNTGTATNIDLGVNFPANDNLYKYRMVMIKESASSYYVQVIRTTLSSGVLLASSIYHLTSDLPTSGGFLQQIMWINNNASAINMKLGDYGLIIKKQ